MLIKYYVKSVYGRDVVYVAEALVAEHIKTLTGRKTLSMDDMRVLVQMGHELEESLPPRKLEANK